MFDNLEIALNGVGTSININTVPTAVTDPVANFYASIEALGYNLTEIKPFLESQGKVLNLACAGAGKSTGFIWKILKGFVDGSNYRQVQTPWGLCTQPKSIWVSTFLASGADELENLLAEWSAKLGVSVPKGSVKFSTLHSEFRSVLIALMKQVNPNYQLNLLTDKERKSLLRAGMAKLKLRSSRFLTFKAIQSEEIETMDCLITYAVNMLDIKTVSHPALDEFGMKISDLELLLQDYSERKAMMQKLDFDDLQSQLLHYQNINPAIRKFLSERYSMIYLDEFQDTSQVQYELLKTYILGAESVFVVGDDDQCIYSWRGSDVNIITTEFEKDFAPIVCNLNTNYRCTDNILNFCKSSICFNENRHPKALTAKGVLGDTVQIYTKLKLSDFVSLVEENIQGDDVCGILSRQNVDLLLPTILLELTEKNYSVSNNLNMRSSLVTIAFSVFKLWTSQYLDGCENLLKLIVTFRDRKVVEDMLIILKNNPGATIFNINKTEVYSSPALCNFIQFVQSVNAQYGETLQSVSLVYIYLITKVLSNREGAYYNSLRALMQGIVLLIHQDVFKDFDVSTLDAYLNSILPGRIEAHKNLDHVDVRLTTVHDSKGKGWDNVIIFKDVEGCFPNTTNPDTLPKSIYEEERRLHYIACTRAKKKLTIITKKDTMSPFLKECDMCYATIKD